MSQCTNITASKVLVLTDLLHRALHSDKELRDKGEGPGTAEINAHTKMDKLSIVSVSNRWGGARVGD